MTLSVQPRFGGVYFQQKPNGPWVRVLQTAEDRPWQGDTAQVQGMLARERSPRVDLKIGAERIKIMGLPSVGGTHQLVLTHEEAKEFIRFTKATPPSMGRQARLDLFGPMIRRFLPPPVYELQNPFLLTSGEVAQDDLWRPARA